MKKTEFDAKQWILELINTSPLKAFVNGKVYKNRRPAGSQLEDVVINAIVMDNRFLQDGAFNVNCYVPYKRVTIDNVVNFLPNEERSKAIADVAYPVFDNVFKEKFNLTIERVEVIEVDEEKASYVNFRINLKAYN